jgi:hypothetical protein
MLYVGLHFVVTMQFPIRLLIVPSSAPKLVSDETGDGGFAAYSPNHRGEADDACSSTVV